MCIEPVVVVGTRCQPKDSGASANLLATSFAKEKKQAGPHFGRDRHSPVHTHPDRCVEAYQR
jgi:hypothetical protein